MTTLEQSLPSTLRYHSLNFSMFFSIVEFLAILNKVPTVDAFVFLIAKDLSFKPIKLILNLKTLFRTKNSLKQQNKHDRLKFFSRYIFTMI